MLTAAEVTEMRSTQVQAQAGTCVITRGALTSRWHGRLHTDLVSGGHGDMQSHAGHGERR